MVKSVVDSWEPCSESGRRDPAEPRKSDGHQLDDSPQQRPGRSSLAVRRRPLDFDVLLRDAQRNDHRTQHCRRLRWRDFHGPERLAEHEWVESLRQQFELEQPQQRRLFVGPNGSQSGNIQSSTIADNNNSSSQINEEGCSALTSYEQHNHTQDGDDELFWLHSRRRQSLEQRIHSATIRPLSRGPRFGHVRDAGLERCARDQRDSLRGRNLDDSEQFSDGRGGCGAAVNDLQHDRHR